MSSVGWPEYCIVHESLGALVTSAVLAALQVVLWAVARRRVELARAAAGPARLATK